ncbi:MAG: 23S rRNA (pseudouridine(1915)-N(3))-methyltransferase RlmH [Bacteroidales bacterium]|nr:23S rRNA (pseudouridine(1915)-N(3))-methyltransferase RlmH [Bacteroidales bacterium]
MKVTLLTVGKTDKGWIKDGLEIYRSRLSHYVNFEMKEIPELKNVSGLSKEQIKAKEGELILKMLRPDDMVILLDEHGQESSSMEWSRKLEQLMQRGRNIVYVVGGAYGFSPEVYARKEGMVSLSRMTFSHQMIRVIFTEQLYRAFTIINGEPYHHE